MSNKRKPKAVPEPTPAPESSTMIVHQPVWVCPVHGDLREGFVQFTIAGTESPIYCLRCAVATFERLGISSVTRK